MTPEAWMIVIVAILGSNGLMATMLYAMRNKADVQKINAESAKDTRIKQLEIQLERTKGNREKMLSDEKQSGELFTLPAKFLDAYGKNMEEIKGFRTQIEQIEDTRELDYKRHIDVYDRHAKEGITRDENRDKALREYIHSELKQAIAESQAQSAAREMYKDLVSAFPVAAEHDCNWKRAIVTFSHVPKVRIMKAPLHIGGNEIVGFIASGDEVWMIDQLHRPDIPQWVQVKPVDMAGISGWCELWNLKIEKRQTLTTPKVTP